MTQVAAFKNMTKEQLVAFIEQQANNNASGLIVKRTEKGGVYIRASSFIEHSESKDKDYVAGINMGAATAFALFLNPTLLAQVVESVKQLKAQATAAQ